MGGVYTMGTAYIAAKKFQKPLWKDILLWIYVTYLSLPSGLKASNAALEEFAHKV